MEVSGTVREWLNQGEQLESVSPRARALQDRQTLLATSSIHNISFGTGFSIYKDSILPAVSTVQDELIIVTCFWARSPTLSALNETLRDLSGRSLQGLTRRKLRVRICFSSSSLFQKLFHTTSPFGRTYFPHEWQSKLGLPAPSDLEGLDLEVKSIFQLPFSVMHPKFVLIDRERVLLPSCNVSWEDWFEGCVELSGPVVEQFTQFWKNFWASPNDGRKQAISTDRLTETQKTPPIQNPSVLSSQNLSLEDVPSLFLPSPHHRNPQFSLLPWRSCPPPPPTPLNTFLLTAFTNAKKDIYLQTPNLTSPPVLSTLLAALKRGVTVTVVTSQGLMILEQLLTAGTTTRRCLRTLERRHRRLVSEWERSNGPLPLDVERGTTDTPGSLYIHFYHPKRPPSTERTSGGVPLLETSVDTPEPVQSHLKLTIIDSEITVLGSGNMDRASWYTSQELGVAFISKEFAERIRNEADWLMMERTGR